VGSAGKIGDSGVHPLHRPNVAQTNGYRWRTLLGGEEAGLDLRRSRSPEALSAGESPEGWGRRSLKIGFANDIRSFAQQADRKGLFSYRTIWESFCDDPQKDITQATLVRKLNSFTRQNPTKKALWELDGLCRTLYILDYIDDVGLRQNVQKALNRGEAYHRFRRAIAYVNGGKLRVKTEAEQQLWNECSRLLANAIIYYNTALLSRIHEQRQAADDAAALELIRATSPVAWQHINLFGNLDFSAAEAGLDLEALAARYADPEFWRPGGSDDPEEPPLH
jgi:hypothetical protein